MDFFNALLRDDVLLLELRLSFFFAFCAAFFALSVYSRKFLWVPVLATIVFASWALLSPGGAAGSSEGYEALQRALLAGFAVSQLVGSAIWVFLLVVLGRLLRRILRDQPRGRFARWLLPLLAVAPALLWTANALESRRLPDTACSNESILVAISGKAYRISPVFRARIEKVIPGRDHRKIYRYSDDVEKRRELKALCRETDHGKAAFSADLLWITPIAIYDRASSFCAPAPPHLSVLCDGLGASAYQHVHAIKLTRHPEEFWPGHEGWFSHPEKPDLLTGGDMTDGYVCHGDEDAGEKVSCTAWWPIDPETTVLVGSVDVAGRSKRELLADLRLAVAFTLRALDP